MRERQRDTEENSGTQQDPHFYCKTEVGISPASERDSDTHGAKITGDITGLGSSPDLYQVFLPSFAQGGHQGVTCPPRPFCCVTRVEVTPPFCFFSFLVSTPRESEVRHTPGRRHDHKETSASGKERSRKPQQKTTPCVGPWGIQRRLLAFGPGWGLGQEDFTREV